VQLISPADEMAQLAGVAVDGLLAPGAAALFEETLQQKVVSPQGDPGHSGIEETRDVGQSLRLVHTAQDRRDLVWIFVWKRFSRIWRNTKIPCTGMI